MNKRIKELIEQSTTIEYGADNGFDRVTFDKEKFAELIVRECADVAYKHNRCDWADVSKSIKEHFGVEE